MLDLQGKVVGWTGAAEQLLGHHEPDVRVRGGATVFTLDVVTPTLQERFGEEDSWSGLLKVRHSDGGVILVHAEGWRMSLPGSSDRWLVTMSPVDSDTVQAPAGSEESVDSQASIAPRSTRLVSDALDRQSPVAEVVWDGDLRCVWRNAPAERLESIFPHFQLGRSLTEPPLGPMGQAFEQGVRRVLEHGVPLIERETWLRAPDGSRERAFSSYFYRLDGADGRPLGVCTVSVEITDARIGDRLSLLGEASVRIGSTLDVIKTAQEVADLAVPDFADLAIVDLAESVLPEPESLDRLDSTDASIPVFHRAGLASIRSGAPEAIYQLGQPVFAAPSSPFVKVLATGRSHFEPVIDTSPDGWLGQDPDRARVYHDVGMHSLIIVALRARGDILGIAQFFRSDNSAPFISDDLRFAEALATQAALSLDSARQYAREHSTALILQRSLLPHRLTGAGVLAVAARYLPSEDVGGDWYDTIPLSGGRIALVVGDVTGHGINAAATMGRLRTAVRTLSHLDLPPDRLLTSLDELASSGDGDDVGEDNTGAALGTSGATCLYMTYDPAARLATIASAGHPPPAIIDPRGKVTFPHPPVGPPVGLGLGMAFPSFELDLTEGSMIALYTDGLIETRQADIETGIDRLGDALAHATPALEQFCDTILKTMIKGRTEDDVSLLLARILTTETS
ncbi:SpoIIE family protein phosphatase [Spirillospora sp. NPDC000708]